MSGPARRARSVLGAVVTAVIAAVVLGGCGTATVTGTGGQAPGSPGALAVVTGDANSPLAVITPTIAGLVSRAFSANAGLALVDAGGRPRLYSVRLGGRFGNADASQAAERQQLSSVDRALDRVRPHVGQSDPWAAASEAVGWLEGQGGGTLVIENSGLGTAGFLDYREPGLLAADPSELVSFARAHKELPDAQGLHAVLVGIGWTAPPQPALGAPERSNLLAQWTALLRAAGATVSVDETPLTGPGPAGAPPVSVVAAPEVSWTLPPGTCGAVLDATELHFVVGTARLVDPAAATAALSRVVAELQANHEVATVTGTTSSEGGSSINLPLSRMRAKVTARMMASMGLPVSQIGSVVGLGSHFPGYVPDIGPGGTLLPGPAAEDRHVVISWPCRT